MRWEILCTGILFSGVTGIYRLFFYDFSFLQDDPVTREYIFSDFYARLIT